MGFFDEVSEKFNQGKDSVSRTMSGSKIKSQISDVNKRRQQLAAQLGASLYDVTRDDPTMRAGRESLYDGIAACDAERAQLQAQLASIEAARVDATVLVCPRCHSHVMAGDRFCSGCGLPIEEVLAANPQATAARQQGAQGPVSAPGMATCPQCGTPTQPGDLFCMNCGFRLQPFSGAEVLAAEAPVAEASQPPLGQASVTQRPMPPAAATSPTEPWSVQPAQAESEPEPTQATLLSPVSSASATSEAVTAPEDPHEEELEPTSAPAVEGAGVEAPSESPADSESQPHDDADTVDPAGAAPEPSAYTCPRCGTRVDATSRFCGGCGLPIDQVRAGSAE